ncbi:Leucine-rich repeat immunoglobulin-like domain and transmembrane domain containing protein 2 [Dissostichus eleginoides]|nr:Leucine-rich repeat immunoglobulin-like domain and transmembrane domain containing protein 2 [Dissostichus eleginoides]
MDNFGVALRITLVFYLFTSGSSTCLTGCSCTDDNLGRSLLCMETSMGRIPDNIPHDFTKIRIENCHLTELPQGSFSKVSALEFLWLNFNEITLMNVKSPASKADKFFHEIQLKTCMKPVASAPETNITLPLGANATLTCLVKARPGPTIKWMYSLKIIRGFAATETNTDEETITSGW